MLYIESWAPLPPSLSSQSAFAYQQRDFMSHCALHVETVCLQPCPLAFEKGAEESSSGLSVAFLVVGV